jgi:hypothetical protein
MSTLFHMIGTDLGSIRVDTTGEADGPVKLFAAISSGDLTAGVILSWPQAKMLAWALMDAVEENPK